MSADRTREIAQSCKWCKAGETVSLMDKDGTLCRVSNEPGTFCHAHDDYWWECPDFAAAIEQAAHPKMKCGCCSCLDDSYGGCVLCKFKEANDHCEDNHDLPYLELVCRVVETKAAQARLDALEKAADILLATRGESANFLRRVCVEKIRALAGDSREGEK